jgi:hypothetical protein
MFQTKVVEKIKTHILYSITLSPLPPLKNRATYEKRWKNTVKRGRPQMTIWRHAGYLRLKTYIHNM